MRNKIHKPKARKDGTRPSERHTIRVGDGRPRSVTLPVIGTIRVHDDTRRLRRMIGKGRARIMFATIPRHGRRWYVTVNCEAADFHPDQHWTPEAETPRVGIDCGITTFAAVADEHGNVHEQVDAPKPLRANLRALRHESKTVSRRRHLSRAVADLGWGEPARQLAYKADWHHAELHVVDRWYPSSKTCSCCGHVVDVLPLSVRAWTCPRCLTVLDRDDNVAVKRGDPVRPQGPAALTR
ncbi:MAG: transposase [Acidimicrobiia bacterium]|nr:transposase [Acidimicrobiia bacterium]